MPLATLVAAVLDRHARIRHKRFAVSLGGIVMPSKSAAKELIQAIKDSCPFERLLPVEYTPLLLAILDWHPGRDEKLQFGCRGFVVRHNPPFRPNDDRGFWIVTERPPPEWVSFSYATCFEPSRDTPDPLRQLAEAGRYAIGLSQWMFKHARATPDMTCPRCNDPITVDTAHVDHVEPKFRDILLGFVDYHGMPPPAALVKRPTYGWQFANPNDAALFAAFHDTCATVREVVCARCNLAAERAS